MPNITKGALSAANVFNRGDAINGTAAIMDICAAAAPIIGSLFAAGGPPGALFGALFSVVGQLLSYFGPKQPSLASEIKKMLLEHEADEQLQTISAVGRSIDVYADKLMTASLTLPGILELPLRTEEDAETFETRLQALNIGLAGDKTRMDTPEFNNWSVLEWLRFENRQDLDKWPRVLSVFCQAYTKLINANVLFSCWPDRNKVQALLEEVRSTNLNSPLPLDVRTTIRGHRSSCGRGPWPTATTGRRTTRRSWR